MNMPIRFAHALLLALPLALLSAPPVRAQGPAPGKAVIFKLFGNQRSAYLVDFAAGQAALLGIPLTDATGLQLSPDQGLLAASDLDGVTIYKVSGLTVRSFARIAVASPIDTRWSEDGRYLTYIIETKNPDGSASDQVFLWDRETRQAKRLI